MTDQLYQKVLACLGGDRGRHPEGYTFYQDRNSADFVAVWDNSTNVTLFYDRLDSINLPPMLAHAVRNG